MLNISKNLKPKGSDNMSNTPTPHIGAALGDIAPKVLMPGDPLRAKYVAENYLTEVKCYNSIRNMYGYTGLYKGEPVSVQGSGMGVSSIGIYSYELFNFYGVEEIIRIGTAGTLSPKAKPKDLVIAMGACHDCNCDKQYRLPGIYAPVADFDLVSRAVESAKSKGITYHVGNVLTAEVYYDASNSLADWAKMGVLCVEMEAAALYMNAAYSGKKALCICTISNDPIKGSEDLTPAEREQCLTDMITTALDI